MKKILNITALVLCVAVVIGMGVSSLADASIDRISPNQSDYKVLNIAEAWGYMQIQPSYNENGKHAQIGYAEFIPVIGNGGTISHTAVGTHEGDSRILSTSHVHKRGKDSNGNYIQTSFRGWYISQPHTGDPTRPWPNPLSLSPIENLVKPELMK